MLNKLPKAEQQYLFEIAYKQKNNENEDSRLPNQDLQSTEIVETVNQQKNKENKDSNLRNQDLDMGEIEIVESCFI